MSRPTETPSPVESGQQQAVNAPATATGGAGAPPATGTGALSAEPEEPEMDAGPPQGDDRFYRRAGLLIILVFFVGLGGWAALAPIDGAVVARGSVTVESYRQTIQHLEGGIIERLHVEDGDHVDRDDPLLTLDDTRARAEYDKIRSQFLSALARQARLEAELEQAEQVTFPDELHDRESPRAERVMELQRLQFHTRREALRGELRILEQQVDGLEARLEGMQAQRQATRRMVESLEEEVTAKQRLAESEAISRAEIRPLERELAQRQGEAGELRANIASTRVEAERTRLEIVQRRHEFQREAAAAQREASDRVDSLREELISLRDTLERMIVRAPVGGEVVNLRFHARRAVIQSGEPVLDLVPRDEPLVLEVRVRPQDVDRIDLDQTADVRLTAFSFRTTPVVQGRVTFVSADSLEDEQSGEEYYKARVAVPQSEIDRIGKDVTLRPGMPADVLITTGERTPLEYLMKPLTDAVARSFRE